MGKSLVIVESPTKAKTIAGFLPRGYVVESSVGHIRDLPNSASEIPSKYKSEPWARLGINIDEGFEPIYVVPREKKKTVSKLKDLLKEADAVYLATDEDREGESISWHLAQVLKPKVPLRRLVFHEITREAIEEALSNPREVSEKLVEAQETRRILDRLYGYEISPILWRKIAPRLSAGRVQSVATRIIVERERERKRFVRSEYWDLVARFATEDGSSFEATLVSLGGKKVAQGSDFDPETGQLKQPSNGKGVVLLEESEAARLRDRLEKGSWEATLVEHKPGRERPAPPFTTSTLQQEANRKLRLSTRKTMSAAQRLYENGLITYMRTDSTTLSDQALSQTRRLIEDLYGSEFLPGAPRQYQTRVKNAQEAHEAIRPAGGFRRPEEIRGKIGDTELKLYELIWKRTMACQMADARVHSTTIQVTGDDAVFQTSGRTIEFPGFLRAYVEGADDPDARLADMERALPAVEPGQTLDCENLEPKSHSTQPPRRYTEASLVKELEANGVGRPSTYATIIDTIIQRKYVVKQGNALVPTFTAFAVVSLMEKNFSDLVDIQFTARMEDDLDAISLGEEHSQPYLERFYFGNGDKAGLKRLIEKDIDARESCTLPLGKDSQGREINVRIGRYGPYLERGKDRAPIPTDLAPDEVTIEKATELIDLASDTDPLGKDPETGKPVYVKSGRYGPYVQLGDSEDDEKPRMKSLLPGMKPDEVTLQEALKLLSLPRSLGMDPETEEEVFADFGRFGPYVKRGSDTRSVPRAESIFDVTLERARQIFREEKSGRGWRRAPTVLKELGKLPDTETEVKLLDGRYGPYVTDGTTNASLPKATDPASVTLEQAVELIRARAAAGPRGRKGGRKKTGKSPKSSKAKKTSSGGKKKTAAKKAPAKKR